MRRIFFFSLLVFVFSKTDAQNFNYALQADSTGWSELNLQTILNANNAAWNSSYRIPIGFSFQFNGRSFDSLTFESNGAICFDAERRNVILLFPGLGDVIDSSGNHPVLGYDLAGTAGNRILKIQIKDAGTSLNPELRMSYQLWLRENGAIEMVAGNGNAYQLSPDPFLPISVGLINMNMDSVVNGIILSGSAHSPDPYVLDQQHTEMPGLTSYPSQGDHYVFLIPGN